MIIISEAVYSEMKRLISEYESESNKLLIELEIELPYIETVSIVTDHAYNKKYGDHRICGCGHEYHRHFDSYEKMEPVGCKYCECYEFKEK